MTTSATSSTSAAVAPPFWIRGLIAAAVANVVIRPIASAAGADMLVDAQGTSTAVTPAAVLIATTLPIVLGGVFVWLLARRTPRAQVVFAWVGLILGVATIPVPLLSTHDIATGLSLASMRRRRGGLDLRDDAVDEEDELRSEMSSLCQVRDGPARE